VVVAAIGDDLLGATTGPADLASHRRDPLEERDQLGDVVAVAARKRPGEGEPARVD
jgi:hypothetical protein